MKRRDFLKALGLGAATAAVVPAVSKAEAPPSAPPVPDIEPGMIDVRGCKALTGDVDAYAGLSAWIPSAPATAAEDFFGVDRSRRPQGRSAVFSDAMRRAAQIDQVEELLELGLIDADQARDLLNGEPIKTTANLATSLPGYSCKIKL